jgi:hypothetical protein
MSVSRGSDHINQLFESPVMSLPRSSTDSQPSPTPNRGHYALSRPLHYTPEHPPVFLLDSSPFHAICTKRMSVVTVCSPSPAPIQSSAQSFGEFWCPDGRQHQQLHMFAPVRPVRGRMFLRLYEA